MRPRGLWCCSSGGPGSTSLHRCKIEMSMKKWHLASFNVTFLAIQARKEQLSTFSSIIFKRSGESSHWILAPSLFRDKFKIVKLRLSLYPHWLTSRLPSNFYMSSFTTSSLTSRSRRWSMLCLSTLRVCTKSIRQIWVWIRDRAINWRLSTMQGIKPKAHGSISGRKTLKACSHRWLKAYRSWTGKLKLVAGISDPASCPSFSTRRCKSTLTSDFKFASRTKDHLPTLSQRCPLRRWLPTTLWCLHLSPRPSTRISTIWAKISKSLELVRLSSATWHFSAYSTSFKTTIASNAWLITLRFYLQILAGAAFWRQCHTSLKNNKLLSIKSQRHLKVNLAKIKSKSRNKS